MASQQDTVRALLDRHGRTFAEELGIDVSKGTPAPLFRLLCAAALMSARIGSGIATEATRNLAKRGWRSPRKLAESTWKQRVEALNAAGYTRYQERTATMLGDLTDHLLDRWNGDLRRLLSNDLANGAGPRPSIRGLGLGDDSISHLVRHVHSFHAVRTGAYSRSAHSGVPVRGTPCRDIPARREQ